MRLNHTGQGFGRLNTVGAFIITNMMVLYSSMAIVSYKIPQHNNATSLIKCIQWPACPEASG